MKILYCFLLVCAITSVTSGWCWDRRRRRRRRSPPPVTVPAPPPPVYRPPPPPVYRPPSPPVYRPPSPPVYRPPPSHAPASYTVISTMTIQVNIRTLLLIIAKNQGTLNIDLKRAEDVLSKQKSISTGHEVRNVVVKIVRMDGVEYALLEGDLDLKVPRQMLKEIDSKQGTKTEL